jgi:hypothetical protein
MASELSGATIPRSGDSQTTSHGGGQGYYDCIMARPPVPFRMEQTLYSASLQGEGTYCFEPPPLCLPMPPSMPLQQEILLRESVSNQTGHDTERLHRKRHAARLRQQRCRAKKRAKKLVGVGTCGSERSQPQDTAGSLHMSVDAKDAASTPVEKCPPPIAEQIEATTEECIIEGDNLWEHDLSEAIGIEAGNDLEEKKRLRKREAARVRQQNYRERKKLEKMEQRAHQRCLNNQSLHEKSLQIPNPKELVLECTGDSGNFVQDSSGNGYVLVPAEYLYQSHENYHLQVNSEDAYTATFNSDDSTDQALECACSLAPVGSSVDPSALVNNGDGCQIYTSQLFATAAPSQQANEDIGQLNICHGESAIRSPTTMYLVPPALHGFAKSGVCATAKAQDASPLKGSFVSFLSPVARTTHKSSILCPDSVGGSNFQSHEYYTETLQASV